MGGIHDCRDVLGAEPVGQRLRPAEPADPDLAGGQGGIADPAGQGTDDPPGTVLDQSRGQGPGLSGSAEDQDGAHQAPRSSRQRAVEYRWLSGN